MVLIIWVKAMKNVLFFILFLFPSLLFSQLQIVGTPEKSTTEFDGVRDVNGRICAAIQIISDMDGFKYDSNNGVVRVDDNPGKDVVHLSPDERVLEIYKTGFEPLRMILSDYGISLNSRDVWIVRLQGEKSPDKIPVTILIEPKDALVYINNEPAGSGPVFQLPKGKMQLRVTHKDYQTLNREIVIDDQNVYFNFKLEEKQDVLVQIESQPSDATLYVDEVNMGSTPTSFFYEAGIYNIRLEKAGFVSLDTSVTFSGENYRISEISMTVQIILQGIITESHLFDDTLPVWYAQGNQGTAP